MTYRRWIAALAISTALSACGGGDETSTDPTIAMRGELLQNPPQRTSILTAAALEATLSASAEGRQLLAIAGKPVCGVEVRYLQYSTTGGVGEATTASGAMMTPSGAAGCSGARPVVLYAHATSADRSFNLAAPLGAGNAAQGESLLLATLYAAQGFTVVAPNYAGYDSSALSYHPYLNAAQQSSDMQDSLAAARKVLAGAEETVQDSGKLFITGYSQGGHVAMATHRDMQAAGQPVTASAPLSGPYALSAFIDNIYAGRVNLFGPIFAPLLAVSYQKAYGGVYASTSELFEPAYASGIDTLLPSNEKLGDLFAKGRLPTGALFSRTPPTAPAGSAASLQARLNALTPPETPASAAALFALGFGTNNLITNQARLDYLTDAFAHPDGSASNPASSLPPASAAHPFRRAIQKNDLRNWTPKRPVLLCGGNRDPIVFYGVNTQLIQAYWTAPSRAAPSPGLLSVVDLDMNPDTTATPEADPSIGALKAGFAQSLADTARAAVAAGATDGGDAAITLAYHGDLLLPFCSVAARDFFRRKLTEGS